MELEGKVILVKNTSKTLSPILRTLVNFQANELAYRKSGYIPVTDEQLAAILDINNIDPSSYSNPLKEVSPISIDTPAKPKAKKKKVKKDIETVITDEVVEVIDVEQIEGTEKEED